MSIKPITFISMLASILVTALGGIALTMAMTWVNPTATPPNNGDIDLLSAGGYDGLGNHQATTDLNLTGHRLYAVNNHGTDRALTATSSNSTIAALITASNNFGTEVQSQANDQPAVLTRNLGTGYALMASSTRGWAAQFGQALQLATSSIGIPARVQWGTGSTNYLSTASAGSAAASSLYWGMMPLCDMGQADCGRVKASLGDNLGNHTAQFNLNMMQHSLINLQNKIGTVLATSSLQLTHVGVGASNFGPGLSAVSQNVNGIVAINTIASPAAAASGYNSGTGYGVTGQSVFGPGISLYGRLKLLTEAASTTLPQLTFGKPVHNASLALTPISQTDQNLYWGDKLLCDSSKTNCGWSAIAGTPSLWNLIGGNLFTDSLVSIGDVGQEAKLETLYPSSFQPSFKHLYTLPQPDSIKDTIDIKNNRLYALSKTGIQIIDITDPTNAVYLRTIPLTLVGGIADMQIVDNYAYIAAVDLIIVDISDAAASAPAIVTIPLAGGASSLDIAGKYAYVGTWGNTFFIYDISNPLGPQIASSTNVVAIHDHTIVVDKNYAYLLTQEAKLQIIDISNPNSPVLKGSYQFDNEGWAIRIRGSIAYVAENLNFSTLDISNPSNPRLLDEITIGDKWHASLEIAGRYAYIGSDEGRMEIVDINDPSDLKAVKAIIFPYTGYHHEALKIYGGRLYTILDGFTGVLDQKVSSILIPSSSFDAINLGFAQLDRLSILGNASLGSIYLASGLSVGGDVTLSTGSLNSGVGIINIGGVKLDRGLLQTLITWSNQP